MSLHRQTLAHPGNARAILLVEMVSIIVAVALGFFVTELRDDINNSRRADAALEGSSR